MPADQAKLFCATLYANADIYDQARTALEQEFGAVEIESPAMPFTHTRYYEKEMGPTLIRRFISFENMVLPDSLAAAKLSACRLERQLAQGQSGRTINLDPGLVTLHNVQLASTKNFAHRLYLGDGIYGEVSLIFENGFFRPLSWTYPDYREAKTLAFLQQIRQTLMEKSPKMVDRY
jgi:hypothetical protein